MSVTLLLVEDDVRQREALRALFEESSPEMTVVVAGTLEETHSHDRYDVDAVLLDLGLPDSSGLATLTSTLERFASVPVIVMTADTDAVTAEQALALGADDFLEKALLPPGAIHRIVHYAIRQSVQRREMERLLDERLHAQRLESLGTLAGGIAHDLNNILMPIRMGAEYLRRVGVPPEAEPTVERIASSSRRGAEIIHQLMTFARGYRVDSQVTNPERLVEEAERMLREALPPSIEIATRVDANVQSIACDPTQVLQVLLNLGLNARDAMPEGGKLSIHAENADADETPGAYVVLSVSDTGVGIPPEALDRIFEPFFTTKAAGAGMGLGLSTARAIVRNHGGFIHVDSEPGTTVFKVHLPALHEPVPDVPIISGNGELVLVIDDEMTIRDVTASTLQSSGYRVLTAAGGSEGITLYERNPDVAVVLVDMLMPGVDGPATTRGLRKMNPNVRVIGMIGYTRQRMSGPAPDLLLQKPFRAADLLAAIHAALPSRE
ncbi:MAG TPA: response regulator [Thermoanaerobaculia bacterium]|nr:response regulator [Thermoanaerobaculia bacterium]